MNSTATKAILAQIEEWEAEGVSDAQITIWIAEILADLYGD